MQQLQLAILLLLTASACTQSQTPPSEPVKTEPQAAHFSKHEYEEMPLSDFIEKLFSNHLSSLKIIENQSFEALCTANQLSLADSLNQSNYLRIKFLHDLFTSSGAYDCNTGGILKLPYFWHWTLPNSRYEIEYLTDGTPKKLTEIKSPPGFQRYKSLADVDRTPLLYLGDMVTETPKYRHPDCGDFYTFGWCSEREMAFAVLLNLMALESKVVVSGNHSWTETLIGMTNSGGGQKWMLVKADNTFDKVSWSPFNDKTENWLTALGTNKTDNWYNEKARSKAEQNAVKAIRVMPIVSSRVEDAVLVFYNKSQR